ncbi:hypothetical protein Ahy_A09g042626 [Arachis hypogaea]|uniref:Uncharacterized protein n=1 Tax=Arachis hypogaea TaxID=3818 RepID=A0A445BGD8_ARAHY|nr:hypothetical protein Ahy_A09g042626 [Arachis hypogaea]
MTPRRLAFMEQDFASKMVRIEFYHEIWTKIEGSPITSEKHIKIILKGLNEDYQVLFLIINSKPEAFSLSEVETLFLTHEDMLKNFRKLESLVAQTNLTQSQSGGRKGRGGRFNRGGWNSFDSNRPQYQVCGRIGHLAWYYFHKFDHNFSSPSQSQSARSTFSHNSSRNSSSQPSTRASTLPPPSNSFHNPIVCTAIPSSVTDDAWYPDTGASHHVTHDQSNLLFSSEYQSPDQTQ